MAVQNNGFTWSFNYDKLDEKLGRFKYVVEDAAESGMASIGKAAVNEIRKLIELRGNPITPWSGVRYYRLHRGNSPGRNDTGYMKESVDYETFSDEVIFGWVYDQEDYFMYQEEGTARIAPMFALRDAATLASKVGPGLVSIAISRAIRQAGF